MAVLAFSLSTTASFLKPLETPPEPFVAPLSTYITYIEPEPVSTTTDARVEPTEVPYKECYCASYIREKFNPNLPRGNAWDFKKGGAPHVGAIAIFNYNGLAHVAYTKAVYENGIVIAERISIKGKCIDRERFIEWGKDKNFVGFAML